MDYKTECREQLTPYQLAKQSAFKDLLEVSHDIMKVSTKISYLLDFAEGKQAASNLLTLANFLLSVEQMTMRAGEALDKAC